jgi:hypothetical protein
MYRTPQPQPRLGNLRNDLKLAKMPDGCIISAGGWSHDYLQDSAEVMIVAGRRFDPGDGAGVSWAEVWHSA